MKNYKEKFLKHDTLRFEEYLNNVKSGKAKIAAGALLPHEIISCLEDEDGGQVAELQWNRMVEDMLKKGKLNNCLAICDVSGSMCGTPMEVITFSENPMLETVQGDDLRSKIEFVKTMDWGMNTDFQKVFDLILEVASSGRLSEDEMVKRVFVFSDMEFDQASVNPWETDYQVIKRKFTEKGYGGAMPEMVFWNLRDSRGTPVAGKENGVALVGGFSKNLMTLF
ncbi:putative von Willebrand factor A-like domain superfamily [Helianthus anomalus]